MGEGLGGWEWGGVGVKAMDGSELGEAQTAKVGAENAFLSLFLSEMQFYHGRIYYKLLILHPNKIFSKVQAVSEPA